ncbi:MAG: formyltetrahydrofolate deformylase [Planctomycetes bacterium]|nr:formyltetrahydrofolate deformylase [Planctomycetota bacterium]
MTTQLDSAILLISCPDAQGLVCAVTEFILKYGGNIVDLEQHVDREENVFFMRLEWDLAQFSLPREQISESFHQLVGQKRHMAFQLFFSRDVPRMAVFVSKTSHCLFDILSRYQSGQWKVDIPLVVSNHEDLRTLVENHGIKFVFMDMNNMSKAEAEEQQLKILKEHKVNFIVLARYMQILSANFIDHYPNRVINIHHSFLPAFAGAKPYHNAYERGVKIIGATSHYVTSELDAGPIIEQDVVHVRHSDSIQDLVRKGQDNEKVVLSRAIYHHLNRAVLVHNNRTLVFS